ncbi:unknown [Bacteroides sp. CAG:754]|nr:unknown [Bacteroides sp. CAG:754]
MLRALRNLSSPLSGDIIVVHSMPPNIAITKAEPPIKNLYVVSSIFPDRYNCKNTFFRQLRKVE